jgi:hypothetical protein
MTPVFCCGFECGVSDVHFNSVSGISGGNGKAFSTSTVRSGTRSLNIQSNASSSQQTLSFTPSFTSVNKHVFRFYVRFATLPAVDMGLLFLGYGASQFPAIVFKQSDSKIYAGNSAGSTGATGVSVTTDTWYLIDFKVSSSANPWTVDVKVDGTACGQFTIAQVAATGTSYNFGLFSPGLVNYTASVFYDDLIISQTDADYPIGAGFVNHFVPTSDGTHNVAGAADFKRGAAGTDITNSTTDSYLLVDDVPLDAVGSAPTTNDYINAIAPPNATDYTENVFGPASGISTPTVAPRAVEVIVETAQAASQTGSFKLNLNDNGTVDTIKEQVGVAGVTTVAAARKHYALAPTGGAWSTSGAGNFNNLRIRFYSADAAPDQYFVAAMIEAEFAPLVAPTYVGGHLMSMMGTGY